MGEHLPCKQGVKSSNLSISTGRELGKYEPSRSRVDAVSENERKRSLNLQIDQPKTISASYLENCISNNKKFVLTKVKQIS